MRWQLARRPAQRRSRSRPATPGWARRFFVRLRLEYLEERRAPAVLHQGDLVLADPIAGASHTGELIQVDFTSHNQTVIASGGSLHHPTGVLYAADGNLLVANQGAGQILRVNPANGAQTSISVGGSLISPTGLATAGNGDIYVADQGILGSNNGLILKVDPTSGVQMVVARGGMLVTPTGVVASNNGLLYVVDPSAVVPGGTGGVLSINLKTGAQAVVSSGGFFKAPTGITRDVDGTLLVADPGRPGNDGQILRINPANGAQTVISANGSLFDPTGVAVEAIGMVAIADAHAANAAGGGALRVSLLGTGAQSTVTTGNNFAGPFGICVVPEQDTFPNSVGQVTLKNTNTNQSFLINLSGPTTVHVTIGPIGQAADRDANNRDEVATEITAFNLSGPTPLGQVTARLRSGYRSLGQIEERTNGHPGILDLPPFEPGPLQADSFFDMIVEVVVAGAVFHPANALHLSSVITSKPPGQGIFYETVAGTIPLLDQNDQPTPFQLVHSQHTPDPIPTTTRLDPGVPNPSQVNQPVTFTAHVMPEPGLTGTVNFRANGMVLNPTPIPVNSQGVAMFTYSFPAPGTYQMTAVYSGDGTHAGSTSSIVTQVVNPNSCGASPSDTVEFRRLGGNPPPGGIIYDNSQSCNVYYPPPDGAVPVDIGMAVLYSGGAGSIHVNNFTFGYATAIPDSAQGPIEVIVTFYGGLNGDDSPDTTNVMAAFDIPGLPGSPDGNATAYIVTVDLAGLGFDFDWPASTFNFDGVTTGNWVAFQYQQPRTGPIVASGAPLLNAFWSDRDLNPPYEPGSFFWQFQGNLPPAFYLQLGGSAQSPSGGHPRAADAALWANQVTGLEPNQAPGIGPSIVASPLPSLGGIAPSVLGVAAVASADVALPSRFRLFTHPASMTPLQGMAASWDGAQWDQFVAARESRRASGTAGQEDHRSTVNRSWGLASGFELPDWLDLPDPLTAWWERLA